MAATNLHDDDFLDSEERRERALHRLFPCNDEMVGVVVWERGVEMATKASSVWILYIGAMEVQQRCNAARHGKI